MKVLIKLFKSLFLGIDFISRAVFILFEISFYLLIC